MGSSKINRAEAFDQRPSVSLFRSDRSDRQVSDRRYPVATTRDGDEPAYRSRVSPQPGDGLHDTAARAKRANLPETRDC
jgi:hypothetical protein